MPATHRGSAGTVCAGVVNDKARRCAPGPSPKESLGKTQSLRSAGTLPPFSSSFLMTCLCNQTFIEAESFLSPV